MFCWQYQITFTAFLLINMLCMTEEYYIEPMKIKSNQFNVKSKPMDIKLIKSNKLVLTAVSSQTIVTTLASALSVAGVVAFHEAGHFFAARWQGIKIQSYNLGYGPKVIACNDSTNTEYALRVIPLGGYVAFPSNVQYDDEGTVISESSDPDLLQNRPPIQRALVISAGVIANIFLSFLLTAGTSFYSGIGKPLYGEGVVVTNIIDKNAPAAQAGINIDDVIMKVNKKVLKGSDQTVENFVAMVRSSGGKPLDLEILRDSKRLEIRIAPKVNNKGKYSIGVGINAKVEEVVKEKANNLLEAVSIGCKETWKLITFTWSAFIRAVSSGFQGNELSGPITVVQTGAKLAEYSPTALVGFITSLSINLAVLNALPLPALDGGQFVFVALEIIAGKPIPKKIQEALVGVAFSFLLVLSLSTIISDIDKLGSNPIQSIDQKNTKMRQNAMFPAE